MGEFVTCFQMKRDLEWWTERSCLLKILADGSLITLMMCKGNKRVYHRKGGNHDDFFFMYVLPFNEMYMCLPFDDFIIGVLKEMNIALSQLHLNNWTFIQAFMVVCVTINLTPTRATFLYQIFFYKIILIFEN